MNDILLITITAFASIFASTGFWTFIMSKKNASSASDEMLRGLGHDRIVDLGEQYLKRGFISKDEYENLHDYLFSPYKKLGGNGTAEKIMEDVKKLPIVIIEHDEGDK